MTTDQQSEMEDLVRIHSMALSDTTLIMVHTIAAKKYDDATEALLAIKRKTDIVAGYISQLLPCTPTTAQRLQTESERL